MTDARGRYRIVVVCLGNICRSPMAAAVLSERITRSGLTRAVAVESAGTGGWHVGEPADYRAAAALSRAGYPTAHSARQFHPSWFDHADLILGMDYQNVQDLRGIAPDEDVAARVRVMRSFDPSLMYLPEDDPALAIPDPYFGEHADFDDVLAMIEAAADGVLDHVLLEIADSSR